MAAVQAEDVRASFLFVGDLNGHHRERLGSTATNYGVKCFLRDAFGVLLCPFWSTVLQCGARLPIHTVNYWTMQSVVPAFQLALCLNVTLHIVDL